MKALDVVQVEVARRDKVTREQLSWVVVGFSSR